MRYITRHNLGLEWAKKTGGLLCAGNNIQYLKSICTRAGSVEPPLLANLVIRSLMCVGLSRKVDSALPG